MRAATPDKTSQRPYLRHLAVSLLAATLLAVLVYFTPRIIEAAASPTVEQNGFYCVHDVARTGTVVGSTTSGDWLCIGWYGLPQQTTTVPTPVTTPEAWCTQLIDQTGCTGAPPSPDDPTSLLQSVAFVRMYTACGATCPTGGAIQAEEELRRIGDSLAAIYVSNASGLTWGSTSLQLCIEASAIVYSPASTDCDPPTYMGAITDNQQTQRTNLGTAIIGLLQSIETARYLPPGSLVQKNKITAAGRVLAVEAFEFLPQIIGNYFQASSIQAVLTPAGTANPALQLRQATIDANSANATFAAGIANLGETNLGTSPGNSTFMGFLVFGLAGVMIGAMASKITGEPALALAGFLSFGPMLGLAVRAPTFQALMVMVVVTGIVALWFVTRKLGIF